MIETLILASTNPQYDKRLLIGLPVQYIKTTSSENVVYINWFFVFVLTFKTIYVHKLVVFMYWTGKPMNNLLSYCGLVDARIRGSNKDLLVWKWIFWNLNGCPKGCAIL